MESIDPTHTNPKRRVIKTNGSPPKSPVAFVVGERISKGDAIQRVNSESSKKAASIRKAEKKITKAEARLLKTSLREELRFGPLSKSEIARLPAANPIRPPKNLWNGSHAHSARMTEHLADMDRRLFREARPAWVDEVSDLTVL